ncbi:MAG TPA: 2-amino-4-hydroxy-6-hydroxymethyldihydropteridine diphosphokinase [Paracoccus sp. (in: a-proteobacteria)]|uniref:2-amino-4-hydroxy-6- hydroxymethyldihydropteridine diphosphokinase n=1 Tax=Paracoccus sp. TaxID=267 RepID=UPI002BF36CFA|nr:2-amino-4-hydroxy-6-hydroxymethyldihydropteridine diphosphokinase [Paracoccus sp. (in: a-proteobacteria)]HWL58234.1 2-amino-4-hydroxy-6-hydroxymethyldihydropteridine diphosphokinase [Paracoccus sp. (in: a-proteobacteria)]
MTQNILPAPNLALVAIGGNLPSSAGPPVATIRAAIGQLVSLSGVSLYSLSRFWQTPAFPAGSGPNYVNAALALQTEISAASLLSALHAVEADFGRRREGARWQARGIDLDLIAYGDLVLPDERTHDHWRGLPPERQSEHAPPELILPHPRLQDRGFVLAPLAEIAPGWVHPRLGRSASQLLAALPAGAMAGIRPLTA